MTSFHMILISLALLIGTTVSSPKKSKHAAAKHSHHTSHSRDKHFRADDDDVEERAEEIQDEGWEYENTTYVDTRRILYSKRVSPGKRPYMVYLQLTKESAKAHKYRGWLCGGVIVDAYYVLTSAACVEDADRFYIVSGTTKFVDSFDYKEDECVCKHRRKVVWKCIPKNYKFDFQDSIKWSSNDIAIVKVDKPFKFGVREEGCEFATDLVCYNNVSRDLEKPGTKGCIAGWGSGSNFREGVYRRQKDHVPENAKSLQEAKVCVMDNEQCAKKWAQKFRNIITQYMICTKDVMKRLSEICDNRYANCTDVENRRHYDDTPFDVPSRTFNVDLGRHLRDPNDYTARRSSMYGGFCENDHGGPLIVRYQGKERVIGVISACKIDPKSHNCHGPFLYTSIFRNRQFISCAIHKDVEENCRRVFRTGITHEEWSVDWDDVEEDDDDQDGMDRDDDGDDQQDKADSGKSSDESDDEKDVLRELNGNNKTKSKKGKQGKEEGSSSSSNESVDAKPSKRDRAPKKEENKKENKPKGKTKKSKLKSKSSKKHSMSKKDGKVDKESEKSKESSDEVVVRTQNRGEVFYESSSDENVNEPDDEQV